MTQLFPFFVIMTAGVFFSAIFNRLHLPWVIALILSGVVIGPSGFNMVEGGVVVDFFAQIGIIFLMFMAGLETQLGSFKETVKSTWVLALINGIVPFIAGLVIGSLFGYSLITSLLLGVIFVSSSIAVVIPSLESTGLFFKKIGHTIVVSTMLQDIASLFLLSLVFQHLDPVTSLPLPVFYGFLLVVLVFLRWALPKIQWFFHNPAKDLFQQEIRTVFFILIGTVILFELLGLHPIVAGFFSGLVLSDSISSVEIRDRLHAISYGIFIPIFFVLVGIETNISLVLENTAFGLIAGVIIAGSVISKVFSGYFGARLVGFKSGASKVIAVSSIPQLSTTLAVVFTAREIGYIDQKLLIALVLLTLVTTFIAPFLISHYSKKIIPKKII